MSASEPGHDQSGAELGHGHGDSPFIQHHFDDGAHQFESGKLGIWLFLGQEVLFFSALFVAYIIYRHNHPEIFEYAHKYLDVKMGAINTGVLILSSLSAAWAVRAAQLNQQRLLIWCLVITLLCAFGFLGIKYVEYSHKVHVGTLFGKRFAPTEAPDGSKIDQPDATPGKTAGGAPAPGEPLNTVGGVKAQPVPGAEDRPPAGSTAVVPDDPAADKEARRSRPARGSGSASCPPSRRRRRLEPTSRPTRPPGRPPTPGCSSPSTSP
jgi:hypothetical protein